MREERAVAEVGSEGTGSGPGIGLVGRASDCPSVSSCERSNAAMISSIPKLKVGTISGYAIKKS